MCRGGLVEGRAPFTKDVCYLDGLLRVTNFLRIALTNHRQTREDRAALPGRVAHRDHEVPGLVEKDAELFGKTKNPKGFVVITDGQDWSGTDALRPVLQ